MLSFNCNIPQMINEITRLSEFDDEFCRTFGDTTCVISELMTQTNVLRDQIRNLAKRQSEIQTTMSDYLDRIKKLRATNISEGVENVECNMFDCAPNWFKEGTHPSIKMMLQLAIFKHQSKTIARQIWCIRDQILALAKQIATRAHEYSGVIKKAKSITAEMDDVSKEMARDIFCWGKIDRGICTYHQCGRCQYGDAVKRHIYLSWQDILMSKSRL